MKSREINPFELTEKEKRRARWGRKKAWKVKNILNIKLGVEVTDLRISSPSVDRNYN